MTEKATFGAGCFWGVESAFMELDGVVKTTVGYAGGHSPNPTYQQVCAKTTGHAEVVEVEFDPGIISYEKLLEVFWSIHDPTQLNRQGPDIGDQYRTVIFYHTPAQQAVAESSKSHLESARKSSKPIVTQIQPAPVFYPAEEYHQQYFLKKGLKNTCHLPIFHD